MPIANYSTSIDAGKTVGEIQGMLAAHGAESVMIEYRDRQPTAVSFTISVHDQPVAFRLSANAPGVLEAMRRDPKVPKSARTPEQATRTAWRIVRDWLRAQLAMIEAEVVTLAQVMLPYAVTDSGATVYMDPPDGGGVDRVEVVRRYIEHLTDHAGQLEEECGVLRAEAGGSAEAEKRLTADLAAARAERDQLAGLVDDLTLQSTYGIQDEENGDGAETFDSGAISAYADGLRDMARRGKVRITHDVGRRVIAVFTDEELARQEREVEEHRERFRAALAALPTPPDAEETER